MLRRLIASVDMLCNSADVVGSITPETPQIISPKLKPTIKR